MSVYETTLLILLARIVHERVTLSDQERSAVKQALKRVENDSELRNELARQILGFRDPHERAQR